MRAMLGMWCLQCLLLTSAAGAASLPPARGPPASAAKTAAPAQTADAPASGAAAAQPPLPQDLLFACPTSLDHIGRVVASVMIDGKGPFRFVVDTGANHSTISPYLAKLLGLAPSLAQSIRVIGITGSAQVASVPIEMLQAGDLQVAATRFPVIWSPVMAGAAGILGAAGLKDDRLTVDFEHNQVLITRSRGESLPWGFTRLWAARLEGGLLSVPGRVGNVPIQAIIDTGSEHTLGNLALYRELFRHEQGKGVYLDTKVYGATEQVGDGKLQLAPEIDLGAIRVGGVALVFGDFHIFQAWGLTNEPVIILGMDVLGTVKALTVDYRYGEIGIDSRMGVQPAVREESPCRFGTDMGAFSCGG
jgi:predicted aspartyl protease